MNDKLRLPIKCAKNDEFDYDARFIDVTESDFASHKIYKSARLFVVF